MVTVNPNYTPEVVVVVNLNREGTRVILRTQVSGDDGEIVQRDIAINVPPVTAGDAEAGSNGKSDSDPSFDDLYQVYGCVD